MVKPSLKVLYEKYKNSNNVVEKEGYGTLYRMAGGKKEIPEYCLDMMCYISGVGRLIRADKRYTELLKENNEKFSNREEQKEYYISRYFGILSYFAYIFDFKLKEKRDNSLYRYSFESDSFPPISGFINLEIGDLYTSWYSDLRNLKSQFDYIKYNGKLKDNYLLELYNFEQKLIILLQQMNCTLGTGQNQKKEGV